ncbi:MAG: hypothetical protein KME12_04940 [Trichocoleus desertorum ATA4-8-CV12]|jgi:hypothetical protein|nr:hypothetical protein [Trichocoleus desertorum ATA4-8-CV12]
MQSETLTLNDCIWECMTTPTNLGSNVDTRQLRQKINMLRKRWEKGNIPTAYTYLFPINTVGSDAEKVLGELQTQYIDLVKIKYFDCNQYQIFLKQALKMSDVKSMQDFINYIQNVRAKNFGKDI